MELMNSVTNPKQIVYLLRFKPVTSRIQVRALNAESTVFVCFGYNKNSFLGLFCLNIAQFMLLGS